jgi:hypothetical protein
LHRFIEYVRFHAMSFYRLFPMPALMGAALVACGPADSPETAAAANAELCAQAIRLATLPPQLDEASGVAISSTHDGVLWVHNDAEGTPSLYALDFAGALLAEIELPADGARVDWEDMEAGPCPAGSCLYIGDIGDNLHDRQDRAILRLPEPQPRSGTVTRVERFPFAYPDGPRDAEALFVMPDTTLFIISKGRTGPVTLYRYPPPFRPDERVVLERLQELTPGLVQLPDLVTGASAAPDGRAVAVRTYTHLQLYRMQGDTLTALWPAPGYDLVDLDEPQGEGVALAADGTVYLVSETGIERRQAPLSRLRCRIP